MDLASELELPQGRDPVTEDEPTYPRTFVRFQGILWEGLVFDHIPGWETEIVHLRSAEGDGTCAVELRDEDAGVLVTVFPEIRFRRQMPNTGQDSADVLAYVPLHPEARELVLRRGDRQLFSAPVASRPPELRVTDTVPMEKDRVQMRWSAQHSLPLSFLVLYLTEDDRAFVVAGHLTETAMEADLSALPGSRRGRLAVLATDGLRSAFQTSPAFHVSTKPPRVWIQAPVGGSALPADQPLSLIGLATDVGGMRLSDEGLVWLVDGKVVIRDIAVAPATGLEPGVHGITLRYEMAGRVVAEAALEVTIAERSPEQERMWDVLRETGVTGLPPPPEGGGMQV